MSEAFPVELVLELCRVAAEVRIFPLIGLDGNPARHVEPVVAAAKRLGRSVKIETDACEFQKGAKEMLRIV